MNNLRRLASDQNVVKLLESGPAPGKDKAFILVSPMGTLLDNNVALDETIKVTFLLSAMRHE